MKLVKINDIFCRKCKIKGTESEIMFNKKGRPCVLLIRMKYKNEIHKFVVPLRSNISAPE